MYLRTYRSSDPIPTPILTQVCQLLGKLDDYHWDLENKTRSPFTIGHIDPFTNQEYEQFRRRERRTTIGAFESEASQQLVGVVNFSESGHLTTVRYDWLVDHFDGVTEIASLYVEEDFRRKGIAKLLLKEVEAISKKNRIRNIALTCFEYNTKAKSFYERLGYIPIETIVHLFRRKMLNKTMSNWVELRYKSKAHKEILGKLLRRRMEDDSRIFYPIEYGYREAIRSLDEQLSGRGTVRLFFYPALKIYAILFSPEDKEIRIGAILCERTVWHKSEFKDAMEELNDQLPTSKGFFTTVTMGETESTVLKACGYETFSTLYRKSI